LSSFDDTKLNNPQSELDTTRVVSVWLNGQPRQLAPGTSVAALLAELGLPLSQVAVEINRELAPRADHSTRELADGDRLEIVTLVGGG
jgi:thiamine biosynthesis protein ThiS